MYHILPHTKYTINRITTQRKETGVMKRNLILGLVTLGAASMLCGFDSAETAESVLNKMQEASMDAENVAMDMVMDVKVDVNVGDGETTSTLAVSLGGDFSIAATMDPLAMSMDGSMSFSALGSGQDIAMKMYGVTSEDGAFETYVYTEDSTSGESGWVYDSEDDIDLDALMEASKAMDASALADWGLAFELAPEAVDVDGTECYELSTVIDSATISTILDKTSELAGEDLSSDDDVATALALLDGLKMNLSYCVDAATYLPVSMHIDFNGTDLSTANALVQSMMDSDSSTAGTSVEIVLNNVSIDVTTSYGTVGEITVPQEAIDAVAAGEADSVSDLVDSAI